MTVEQFPGGHSNLTYLLRFGTHDFALRRPPFGPVPPKAHDMARECRILSAIHPVFPLAPKPYLLCEDPSIIGSTFYIMERRQGVVVRYEEPPELANQPERRRRVSESVVDTLADLHLVDIEAHGLNALGKPGGFVERQVQGWTQRWHGSKTSEQAEMNTLSQWLLERLPPDPIRPTLLHGDYKLDNIMPKNTKIDIAGFDVYNELGVVKNGVLNTKGDDLPNAYFKPLSAWANAHGIPWGIAETGYTDYASERYPHWIQQTYASLRSYGGVAFTYFNTTLNAYGSWALSTSTKVADYEDAQAQSPMLR